LTLVALALRGNEDEWTCGLNGWEKHGVPSSSMPERNCVNGVVEDVSLPLGYTLDTFTVEKISDISCNEGYECRTPAEYVIRSNCPYTSMCLNHKCAVVCPSYQKQNLFGGDRDEHGCIGSAGYSWCSVKNKCLRIWEETCEATATTSIEQKLIIKNESTCTSNSGTWYSKTNLCEINSLSENECVQKGGEFNSCASACRNNPDAEVCTLQCVLTCTFK